MNRWTTRILAEYVCDTAASTPCLILPGLPATS